MDEQVAAEEWIESRLLLSGIVERYGYDFREYAQASMLRRLRNAVQLFDLRSISDLQHHVIHDPAFFFRFLSAINVSVTGFFRHPETFRVLRDHAVPILRTYARFKIWHAGCATGEELYSMAILLHEENLLQRAILYGTDINPVALEVANRAVYDESKIDEAEQSYREAGGTAALRAYFDVNYGKAMIRRDLRGRATISDHNLISDSSFATCQIIFCRNTLIYFGRDLQTTVIRKLDGSLCRGGYLCIGARESLNHGTFRNEFEPVGERSHVYRKPLSRAGGAWE